MMGKVVLSPLFFSDSYRKEASACDLLMTFNDVCNIDLFEDLMR